VRGQKGVKKWEGLGGASKNKKPKGYRITAEKGKWGGTMMAEKLRAGQKKKHGENVKLITLQCKRGGREVQRFPINRANNNKEPIEF